MKHLLFVLALCFIVGAQAQTCLSELQTNLTQEQLKQTATGLEAAQYLKQAAELLEPSLPQTTALPSWFAVPSDAPEYSVAKWLAQRDLLVPEWQADSLSLEVWQALLTKLAAWYQVKIAATDITNEAITLSLGQLIDQVVPTLTPVALIASAEQNAREVAFWAVIRNDSRYPRLIVYRPAVDTVSLADGAKSALALLETCAMPLKNFLFASETVARGLFLANHNGQMYLVGSSPEPLMTYEPVASGLEADYLTYKNAATENFKSFSVVFSGERVAATTLLRLLPRVRTNMNPKQVLDFVLGN
jgi:hypothetical protein